MSISLGSQLTLSRPPAISISGNSMSVSLPLDGWPWLDHPLLGDGMLTLQLGRSPVSVLSDWLIEILRVSFEAFILICVAWRLGGWIELVAKGKLTRSEGFIIFLC